MIVQGYRKDAEGNAVLQDIFDIIECTYTGKDMGERSITATVNWASPIDFQIGDYVELSMQSLIRGVNEEGTIGYEENGLSEVPEKFYIYTMPTIKKSARAFEHGTGFEHIITFYPAQYELACIQMRDMGTSVNSNNIIYTGFDNVTFYGGAKELMDRVMEVLKTVYTDEEGNPLWSYEIADVVNEEKNTALERFALTFSGNTVMDALLKLNDKEGINTTFFINGRKIYVGFKRPYFCRVTDNGSIDTNLSSQMFSFQYGKTSHESIAIDHGGLYNITKSIGKESPITKLYAYGASRNLNRYYCSDRLAAGRYVNRLMLPSFSIDGKTDYIVSHDAMAKYGIREGSKQFDDIYPSLQYVTYGDIRQVKYCIKIKASGAASDYTTHSYDVARVQCYKVIEGANGVNTLLEAAPPDDLAVFVHAMDKVVKVILCGGVDNEEAITKQKARDANVPQRNGVDIPGACFLVNDPQFDGGQYIMSREFWFLDYDDTTLTEEQREEVKHNQINYSDTFWLSDLYIFQSYDQTYFTRDGYSAWAWARLNNNYSSVNGNVASDSTPVNTIIAVEPVVIEDTSLGVAGIDKQQQTFDIYLGDVGFKIDEQTDFGDMVFVVAGTVKVSILDGLLAGREFEVSGSVTDSQFSCICAFNDDGTENEDFFQESGYTTSEVPRNAFNDGAIWRLRLNRMNLDDADYSNLNIAIPNTLINASAGDHMTLLDIFMPDIYINAAENRLLREAQKYIDANDSGAINYTVEFDKVRMCQIPNYVLQMREGLNIRMVDEDLNIQTENDGRMLYDYTQKPLVTGMPVDTATRVWSYTTYYIKAEATLSSYSLKVKVVLEYEENWLYNPIAIFQSGVTHELGRPTSSSYKGWQSADGGHVYEITYPIPTEIDFDSDYVIYRNRMLGDDKQQVWLSSSQAIDFTKGRYYNVSIRVKDNGYSQLEGVDGGFRLFTVRNDSTISYLPEVHRSITRKDGESYLYVQCEFYLEQSFDDSTFYYPSVLYVTDGREASIAMELIQVTERDYINTASVLPYADFAIDSLTIKIYDSSNRTFAQPLKEVTATLSEQRNASAWASVMSRVEKTEIESNENSKTAQAIINTARRNYQTLLNLRNSIFDPDGTCTDTFLQVMMLQVGADSMNYFLDKTGISADGTKNNCYLTKRAGNVYYFGIRIDDVLHHVVYVDNGGRWSIPGAVQFRLDADAEGNYPTYFVSIKCPITGTEGEWICSTTQYAVNAEEGYYHFNWGILTADSTGAYELTETRGNAYMYGDNIICGKISTIARNSWFDLTKGEFVLGSDGEDGYALRYVDGVLTISGVNDSSVDSILSRLGLAETNINNISTKEEELTQGLANAIASISDLQSQIDGEVSSYFYPQAPVNSDDSVRIDIEPMSEWLLNYTLTNGVYVPNDDARNELINNLGDTYTNTEVSTPLAGKSWRWCDATNNDAITQYIVVRYTADGVTTDKRLHWHIITDTDALRALEAAANAQSTADGKCTTFLEKPTEGYNVGDLWILEDDNIHPEGKKGDILTANVKRATYNESDWSKKVKYTDDSALANMVIGGRNILRNTKTMSEWTPFAYSDATLTKTTDGTTLINGNQATRIRTEGGSNRYKAIYGLLSMESIDFGKQYALSFNVTALDYSLCIFAKLSEAKGDNTFYKNEVIVPAGETKRVSFVGYPFTEQALQVWFGAAYYDADDATAAEYDANFLINEMKLEIGNKATDWSPAPEDVDAAIDVAASQVEALEYLKEALTDGSTEFVGGLTMTNVLMLKDIPEGTTEGVVTAGMSGISDDNILMWGGGTYDEAVVAKNNEYKKDEHGTEITTLIRKDGQGKIGVFKISDTQAVVDVPGQGKVIIDAGSVDGGITLKDEDGVERLVLSTQTLEDSGYIPVNTDALAGSKSGSGSHSDTVENNFGTYKEITVFSANVGRGADIAVNTLTVNIRNIQTTHAGMTDYTSATVFDCFVYLKYSKYGEQKYQIGRITTGRGVTSGSVTISSKGLDDISGNVSIVLSVSHKITGTSYTSTACNFSYAVVSDTDITINYDPRTVLCKDGLLSAYNSNSYFMVKNGYNGQKIFAKGLSGKRGTEGSGELYVSTNFIDSFKNFVTKAKELFAAARYVGPNGEYQDNANEECNKILAALTDTSLISNS